MIVTYKGFDITGMSRDQLLQTVQELVRIPGTLPEGDIGRAIEPDVAVKAPEPVAGPEPTYCGIPIRFMDRDALVRAVNHIGCLYDSLSRKRQEIVESSGYDPRIPIPDIEAVLKYAYGDEEKGWRESGCPDDHIFNALKRIHAWLGAWKGLSA